MSKLLRLRSIFWPQRLLRNGELFEIDGKRNKELRILEGFHTSLVDGSERKMKVLNGFIKARFYKQDIKGALSLLNFMIVVSISKFYFRD